MNRGSVAGPMSDVPAELGRALSNPSRGAGALVAPSRVEGASAAPIPGPTSRSGGGYRSVLRNRRFLLYQVSAIFSSTGYAVYAISIPWIAYLNSGSFLVVGLVLFLEIGIYACTFLAAPLVDRAADKRVVFLIGYPIQAVAAVVLAFSAAHGELHLPLLFVLVAVLSVAWDFEWAVFQVAPRLLLPKDELFAGQGLGSALGAGVQVGGYTAGAGLILVSGAVGSGFLYAALLVAATLLAAIVPLRGGPASEHDYLAGFVEGWRYLGTPEGRPLLQLGLLGAISGFFSVAPAVLITLDANRSFSDPGLAYGLLFTSFVIGGVAVDLLLGHFNPRHRVGAVIVGSLSLSALALFLTGVIPPSLPLAAGTWFLAGAGLSAYLAGSGTFLLGYVPENRLARVSSNLYVFRGAAGAAGALVVGVLASELVPRSVALIVALVFGVAALASLLLPAIRTFSF
jgi:DHA3 family macrolide efflux protein-like MFS transporter